MIKAKGLLAVAMVLLLGACEDGSRYSNIIDVKPIVDPAVLADPPRSSGDRNAAMLGTFQAYGDLQVMTFFGDFDQVIKFQHQQIMPQVRGASAGGGQSQTGSLFARRTGRDSGLVGRNFDAGETQLLVGWFHPANGYASVALLPLASLGYSPAEPFASANHQHRKSLLYAPVMTIEGMNEKGVTVALAGNGRDAVIPDPDLQPRYLIHLVREILDHAGSVNEAVSIAEKYNVFDYGEASIFHHIFLADPHFGSAVLEWRDGVMHLVKDSGDWQVVTNSDLFEVSLAERRQGGDRYDRLAQFMERQQGVKTWTEAMDVLAEVRQRNKTVEVDGQKFKIRTQWSAVFDTGARSLHLILGNNSDTVYRFEVGTQSQ